MDLTLLSGMVHGLEREMRLMRLQLDQIATGVPPRLSAIEQSFHGLASETARGLGPVQQQIARQEKRLESVDAGLASLCANLNESTALIIQEIRAKP